MEVITQFILLNREYSYVELVNCHKQVFFKDMYVKKKINISLFGMSFIMYINQLIRQQLSL